jgi:hypothetical protein
LGFLQRIGNTTRHEKLQILNISQGFHNLLIISMYRYLGDIWFLSKISQVLENLNFCDFILISEAWRIFMYSQYIQLTRFELKI